MQEFINFNYYKSLEMYHGHVLTIELSELEVTDSRYVLTCYRRALGIFECIFSKDDPVIFVVNTYPCDRINPRPRTIKRYLKNDQLHRTLNCLMSKDQQEEDIIHYYLTCRWSELNYKKLLLHLCQHEIVKNVKPMDDYYIIHLEKNICVRMQDDRFVDVIFKTIEDKLNFINHFPGDKKLK